MRVMVWLAREEKPLANVRQTVMNQVADEVVRGTVEGETTDLACGDELHPPQQRQLVTRHREREVHGPREIADGQLMMSEGVHHKEADGARQEAEDLHGILDHFAGWQALAG